MLLMALGLVFSLTSCRDDDNNSGSGNHKVVFKAVGSEGVMIHVVGHNVGTDMHNFTDLNVNSWSSQEISFSGNAPLNITVNGVGTNANSTLKAQIFVDGTLVKEGTSTGTYLSATAVHNYQ